jgi:hypothetical protein
MEPSKPEHYTDGRRWSHISQAWILLESWNEREEIASLRAQVAALEGERDAQQARVSRLEEALNAVLFDVKQNDGILPTTWHRYRDVLTSPHALTPTPETREDRT